VALKLSNKDIRCTSVDGYRLPIGADTDEILKFEIFEAEAFIALISPNSIKSSYVLFELGARWGAGKHIAPILLPSCDVNILKGPLKRLNALKCDKVSQLHQLIEDLSSYLNVIPENASSYQKYIYSILSIKNK
jgi:hypothetical protein